MTLARAGIVVAIAGGVALAIHADLYAKQVRRARQQSDCAAWYRARRTILGGADWRESWKWAYQGVQQDTLMTALQAPDLKAVWEAREMVAYDPEWLWALLPALRDPTFLSLRNPADTLTDDLRRRAGRASWLLKEVTGRSAPIVRVDTDPVSLADLADDWEGWLHGMAGGAVCSLPAKNVTPVSRTGRVWATTGREAREKIYTVPAGKRLIIQTETAQTDCAGGVKPLVSLVAVNVGGGDLSYAVVPQTDRGGWDGQDESFEGSVAVHMFAEAGEFVEARVWLDADVPQGGGFSAEIGFSGYLADVP
jgi:hypothetical protein